MWPAARPASNQWIFDSSTQSRPPTSARRSTRSSARPCPAGPAPTRSRTGTPRRRPCGTRAAPPTAPHAPRRPRAAGWISPGALDYVCPPADSRRPRSTGWRRSTPCSRVTPRAPRVLHVCNDLACRCAGVGQADRGARARSDRTGPTSAAPPGSRARASACATARRPPSLVEPARAGRARAHAASTPRRYIEILHGATPAAAAVARGAPGRRARAFGCCAASAWSTPRASTTTAPTAATTRCAGRSTSARTASSARCSTPS